MAKKHLNVSPNPLMLTADAQKVYVKVQNVLDIQPENETDTVRMGYIANEWVKMIYQAANAQNIVVEVQENTTSHDRTYDLLVNSYNDFEILRITQKGKTD